MYSVRILADIFQYHNHKYIHSSYFFRIRHNIHHTNNINAFESNCLDYLVQYIIPILFAQTISLLIFKQYHFYHIPLFIYFSNTLFIHQNKIGPLERFVFIINENMLRIHHKHHTDNNNTNYSGPCYNLYEVNNKFTF